MRRRVRSADRREPTIALINIVFLMLIFFLVAGTVARPVGGQLQLVRTAGLDGAAPPDALVIHADGRLSWRGQDVGSAAAFMAAAAPAGGVARVLPDRDLPAVRLMQVAREAQAAGATRVVLVTERSAP